MTKNWRNIERLEQFRKFPNSRVALKNAYTTQNVKRSKSIWSGEVSQTGHVAASLTSPLVHDLGGKNLLEKESYKIISLIDFPGH